MRVLWVVVVPWAVQIGRHRAVEEHAVLPSVKLAHFQAGNLGQGVGFVGFFQRTGQQRVFLDGLRGHSRVDARAAEKQETFDATLIGGVNGVRGHRQVVVDELGWVGVVGVDATDFGCRKNYDFGAMRRKERLDIGLPAQVDGRPVRGQDLGNSHVLQSSYDRAAHHAAMARHINSFLNHALSFKFEDCVHFIP